MLTVDRDKLISAAYSVTNSSESFDENLDAFDAFDSLIINPKIQYGDGSYSQSIKNTAYKPTLDSELISHFKRAHEIQLLLGRPKVEKTKLLTLLDSTPNPAFVFDSEENIVAMNGLAKKLINKSSHELSDFVGNIEALINIRQFIAKPENRAALVEIGNVGLRGDMNTCLLVKKVDVRPDKKLSLLNEQCKELFFLTIVNLGFDQSQTSLFKKNYGLTQAEMDVAIHLADGKQLPEIAAVRGSTVPTIRTHVKRIKKKTQSRDIPAIVRLLCGFSAGTLISSQLSAKDEVCVGGMMKNNMTLRDGRRLEYFEHGSPEGLPVVMFHNMPYGVELPASALKAAIRMKLRILIPYRAGYGGSDILQNAHGDKLLDEVAADTYELLNHLDILKAVIVGQTIGSVYALRFARLYPNRVFNLFAVSYTPNWKDEWISQMPKRQGLILKITMYMPQLLPLVTRGILITMDKGHSVKLIRSLCKESASDTKALKSAEIMELMTRGCAEGYKQGAEAFRRDCFLAIQDLTEEAKLLKHAFHILHGDDDQIVNVSRSQRFVEDVPGTELEVVKGAGQLLMYSHWEHVFKAIIKKQKNCK